MEDIRWKQRFSNFRKALLQMGKIIEKEQLNEIEQQGLIKAFEYTYELSWKTLQDLLKEKGYQNVVGPRPVIEQSFQDGYIADGRKWMEMLKSRNLTSHTYNQETALDVIEDIKNSYYSLFTELSKKLETL